jgi:hypothetical protein
MSVFSKEIDEIWWYVIPKKHGAEWINYIFRTKFK